MKSSASKWSDDAVGYLVVVVIVVGAIFFSLNVSMGPYEQVIGTVRGVSFVQNDGPTRKLVAVQLDNGDVVQIRVSPQLIVQPGEKIKLDVYRRMLTGGQNYALAARDMQPIQHTEPWRHR